MDDSDADIRFDAQGVCSHCRTAEVVLAVALWRSRAVAPWVAGLFGGGLVVNLLGWTSNSIPVIAGSAVVLLVAAVPTAVALLSPSTSGRGTARRVAERDRAQL